VTSPGLIAEARAAGVEFALRDGGVRIRGVCPPELRERLRGSRDEIREALHAELEAERARREAEAPFALLPDGADPDRPPAGWTYVRSGPLAGCWVGPDCELDSGRPSGEPGGAGEGSA